MRKMRSQKEADKIAEKLNKEHGLSYLTNCPRCKSGGYDEAGSYNFEGSTVSFYQVCKDCGIRVTHHLEWVESEVEILEVE